MFSPISLILCLLFCSVLSRHSRPVDDDFEPERDLFQLPTDSKYLFLSDFMYEQEGQTKFVNITTDRTLPFLFSSLKASQTFINAYADDANGNPVPESGIQLSPHRPTMIDILFKNYLESKFVKYSVAMQIDLVYGANKRESETYLIDMFHEWCPLREGFYVCPGSPRLTHQIRGVMIPQEWASKINDETLASTLQIKIIHLPMNDVLTSARAYVRMA